MTVWYNWWTASGWYIIDAFQKRCIYILQQAAGAKTLFRSNLEMRLLNITQKNLSFPRSTMWAKMQNTCKWWTKSKSCTAPRCPLHIFFSAKWVNRLLAHSLLKWGQIFINSPEITLSPKNTVFHFGHSLIALFQNSQKKALLVMEILFPPTKLPHFKAHTFGCRSFFSKLFSAGFNVKRNTQCCWILLKSLFKRG